MGLSNLLKYLENHKEFAIDKFWFVLQKTNRWFLIIPPTVVQRTDYSDIEKRITNYEGIMKDLDKTEMFNAIRNMNKNKAIIQQGFKQVTNTNKNIGIKFI
jgi:hypothetical protein